MENEIWKKVKERQTIEYWVSSQGRCRTVNKQDGRVIKTTSGFFNADVGYMYFDNMLVHRLVAKAFIPNPDGLEQVDHINSDKLDNRVENLRWLSRKQNNSRKHANDMRRRNWRSVRHKNQIIRASKKGEKDRFFKNGMAAAEQLGCSHVYVYNCLNGKLSARRAKGWTLEWVDIG